MDGCLGHRPFGRQLIHTSLNPSATPGLVDDRHPRSLKFRYFLSDRLIMIADPTLQKLTDLPTLAKADATTAVPAGPAAAGVPAAVPPRPVNEAARLAALRAQQVLDSLPEQMFDDIVRVASNVCGTPIALISLVDEDRQWFKAKVGLQASETPRDQAFCAHAILQPDQPFVVPDATQDPRFAQNPLVTGGPDIRMYAGAPIVSHSGHALGTVCVIDQTPRELTADQIDSLQALSRQVSHLLELRRVTRNSVDSVQSQLLSKSDKLREVQRQVEALKAEVARLEAELTAVKR